MFKDYVRYGVNFEILELYFHIRQEMKMIYGKKI